MQCSYLQGASIFCPQPQAFRKPSFHSSFSVAPPQTRKEGSSDYNDVAYNDNFGSEDDILHAISDAKSKFITSAKNPFVKHCLKLRNDSSYRRYHGSVLVVGSTPIREIYRFQESSQDNNIKMDCLILPDKTEIPAGLDKSPTSVVRVSSTVMKKLARLQSTDSLDAMALMNIPTSFFSLDDNQDTADCRRWFPSPHRILVLERIQDPGNLGTLLRSAVAFGWDGVFLLPGCCDPFNDKALKASRGAAFQLPIVSGSWIHLESLIGQFRMKLLGGHPEDEGVAKPVSRMSPGFCDSVSDKPLCLVLGSEGSGLSEKSMEACELVSIPMAGEFESLNVSVAGGIFMYMLQPKCR
ncbi:uncharacterized protein LOC114757977 [Neltuma alba]|uniref:uncharacterized protein LOC114745245 n=1 Tax=Neltuma alba TaxID=207710 RepID=UPI0010A2B4ED|nr:uncharacterized protein LOC114745245 [Prosopis alba]XP_028802792.1 uncharacterized protein LOC114757977 [Prosopis alba]